jgi:hypothetical protein
MKDQRDLLAGHVTPSPLRAAVRAWERFWFLPADPTPLALIRICCGLVTLYTLLAYSFTLQELFGSDGWVNLGLRLRSIYEAPAARMALAWDESHLFPRPETPEQQRYYDEYVQKWGGPPPAPYPTTPEEAAAIDTYRDFWGVDPRLVQAKGSPIWSVWFHVTDPFWMVVTHVTILVIVFLFTIGFCTRLTSVLAWAGALCYIHRSSPSLFGVDAMMTILLTYLMIGPSGAALSVDRWLARWWARRRKAPPSDPALEPPAPSVGANFALRLLQINVCIIYCAAGLSKLQGPAWWNGTAVWGTLANFEFAPMQYESYMVPLRFLARSRVLWEVSMTIAGLFTLTFEIAYVFLVWRASTRWVILGMAITLHGFIGLFMGLKTFSLMMLIMNMAFLSPAMVKRCLRPFTGEREPAVVERPPAVAPVLAPVGAGRKR